MKELRTLEKASPVNETRLMLNKLLATQECEQKEMEEQMAEETCHLNDFQGSYQRLVDDSREYEVIIKSAGQVIAKCSGSYRPGANLDPS